MPETRSSPSFQHYLSGGGEMGERIRAFDWSKSSMGTPDTWPQNLLLTLSTVLNSRFPMFIWWGPDLIQFYNDAYRPSLGNSGKHPAALGQRGEECWPEIWTVIKPLIDQVLSGRGSTWSEDQLIPIYRNDRLEDVYWTFSYTPILSDDGRPGGVLVICHETTEKVISAEHLKQARTAAVRDRDRLHSFLMDAPAGICILAGPDLVYELINPGYQQLLPGRELLNRPIFEALPELIGTRVQEVLLEVYHKGKQVTISELYVPLAEHENGPLADRYFTFTYQPRQDREGNVDGILVFAVDVTETVRARKVIEASERELMKMLDSIPQMTWTNTTEGEVNFYNQRWYDYTGLSYEQTKDWGWKPVVHPDNLEKTLADYLGILTSGVTGEFENRYRRADGEYRWHLNRVVPIRSDDGAIRLWIGTATDIHELKQLQQQKDDFISIASHELKTPITSLKAALQVMGRMKDKPPAPGVLDNMIGRASRSLDKVNNLIEDLLNATKVNRGHLPLSKSRFKLASLINDCCHHVRMEGKYSIIVKGEDDIEVNADFERIDQVIANLVNNAIKYAPDSPEIIVLLKRTDDGFARISVIDRGPGIPPDKLSQLFERYYRAQKDDRQASGLGLGLYICTEIVRRHSGQMGVESELGKGSTFWFEIPLEPAAK